jgi:hypothetical protein
VVSGVTASPSTVADWAQQVFTGSRVLLRTDSQRYALIGDSPLTWSNEGPQGQSAAPHTRRPRLLSLALLTSCLVALVEDAQQFRMGSEHAQIEVSGDLIGVCCNGGSGRPHCVERL